MNAENSESRFENISQEGEGQLTIDVYQTMDDIVIESPIAGVSSDDLDIDITRESVSIRGERHRETCVPEADYLYQECYWGRFSRSVILPQEIDADKASAEFKDGVLRIVLPKLNREKTKKLRVRGN
jgi:HSP20 family protein